MHTCKAKICGNQHVAKGFGIIGIIMSTQLPTPFNRSWKSCKLPLNKPSLHPLIMVQCLLCYQSTMCANFRSWKSTYQHTNETYQRNDSDLRKRLHMEAVFRGKSGNLNITYNYLAPLISQPSFIDRLTTHSLYARARAQVN